MVGKKIVNGEEVYEHQSNAIEEITEKHDDLKGFPKEIAIVSDDEDSSDSAGHKEKKEELGGGLV